MNILLMIIFCVLAIAGITAVFIAFSVLLYATLRKHTFLDEKEVE